MASVGRSAGLEAGGEGFEPYPRTPEASGCTGVVDDIAAETVAGALRVVGVGPEEVESGAGTCW